MPNANDPLIEALDLAPVAKAAAYALKSAQKAVVFTSGRRSRSSQATAMANNIATSGNRDWISETYVISDARDGCQKWVTEHPGVVDAAGLAQGLQSVLDGLDDAAVGKLSKHLSGMAFDVRVIPDAAGGSDVKNAIEALANLDKFITSEGGLTIWHAQFK